MDIDQATPWKARLTKLGVGSVEMHDNAIFQAGGEAPAILRENTTADTPVYAPFVTQPQSGTRNWVQSAVTSVLPDWSGTMSGSDPGFRDLVQRNFSPLATSPLRNAGGQPPAVASRVPDAVALAVGTVRSAAARETRGRRPARASPAGRTLDLRRRRSCRCVRCRRRLRERMPRR